MTVPTLLEVENVSTWFSTSKGTLHAVDDVSFTLGSGKTLCLVGESGSGKSVLARSVMNLLPRTALRPSGRVTFDGIDLRSVPPTEVRHLWGADIAMIFQDPMTSLNPVVRIGRQITESLRFHRDVRGRAATLRAVELLSQVGIPSPQSRLRSYPHELSGGMRQRVCIAMALACEPKLLIADEPTTALDVTIQRQILDLLQRLQAEMGMAMIMVTHNLGIAAGRTDEIAVMYAGRIVEKGPTRELFANMRHPYTAALLSSIPRIERPSQTLLHAIPGRPSNVIDPSPGCRFADRCRHARPRCLTEDPPLVPGAVPGHQYACFHPVGTPEGDEALATNLTLGQTAAGLNVTSADTEAA